MEMARIRYDIGGLLCLILLLQSCGNDASVDAVVSPATQTSTGCTFNAKGVAANVVVGTCQTTGSVQFHVQRSADDATPVADTNIRIDVGNSNGNVTYLLDSTGTTCFNGDPNPFPALPTPGCQSQDTKTDKFGNVSFQVFTGPFFGCGALTTDITSITNAKVTISNSAGVWEMENTIKCT
jgi:hypothetical protein